MKKIGVILSGCGVYDGAEIHEAVLTLLAIEIAKAEAVCLAPNVDQAQVVDHLTGEIVYEEKRNVLREAARIARGKIQDTAKVSAAEFDALIVVGGYGAAKNLSNFAFAHGGHVTVEATTAKLLRDAFALKKPLGFLCISPVVAAEVLKNEHVELTIGHDAETAKALEAMGAKHVAKAASEIHRDPRHPIVSSPAYMLGQSLSEVAAGIDLLVAEVVRLIP